MKRIDDWHAKNAMQTAIIDGEEAVTYQELEQRVQERANILAGIPQKVILAPMSNAIDQLINFLALIRADKVAVPVNAGLSDQGLQDILTQFEDPLVLTDIHTISEKAAAPFDSAEYAAPSDLAFIGFTSGTTGQPKGYRRTHQSWVKSFEGTNDVDPPVQQSERNGFWLDALFVEPVHADADALFWTDLHPESAFFHKTLDQPCQANGVVDLLSCADHDPRAHFQAGSSK